MWRLITVGPRTLYKLGLGWVIGGRVLLLKTTGRKSGIARTTPLQYDLIDGKYLLGSARGIHADWVQNILINPGVSIQVGRNCFNAVGKVVTAPEEIADFVQLRYAKHPFFVRLIFRLQGYRGQLSREDFVRYARNRVVVVLDPVDGGN